MWYIDIIKPYTTDRIRQGYYDDMDDLWENGIIITCNEEAGKLLGLDKYALIGNRLVKKLTLTLTLTLTLIG